MDGKSFYEAYKEALDFIGVGFRGMEHADVWVEGDKLHVKFGESEAVLTVKEKK